MIFVIFISHLQCMLMLIPKAMLRLRLYPLRVTKRCLFIVIMFVLANIDGVITANDVLTIIRFSASMGDNKKIGKTVKV